MKRLKAEWEEQDATIMALPNENSEWSEYYSEAVETILKIAFEIAKEEVCIILCSEENIHLVPKIRNIKPILVKTNDIWCRDYCALSVLDSNSPVLVDFLFNAWGLKYPSNFDNQVNFELKKLNIFQNLENIGIVLEGGGIDTNGEGLLLLNSSCILEKNRNPYMSKKDLENKLKEILGIKEFLWVNHGYLSGDDTDGHIDTLARFIDKNSIVYVKCDDVSDEHYYELAKMEKELQEIAKSFKLNLYSLPFVSAKYYDGVRLPATYANFLFINNAILFPIYDDESDEKAINIMKNLCKNHKIIPINCSVLIREKGSLHCATMQIGKGNLSNFII